MRDEIKAAAVFAVLAAAFFLLFTLYHPVRWTWQPTAPAADSAPRFDILLPPVQFDQFIALYGPPSSEELSPHGRMQPPMFTKWLDYEPEHLRVAFVSADAPEMASGHRWVLIAFVDATRTAPLSAQEAGRRLSKRRR